jgi:transcriptional regulator with XRE-family HTH domain
VSHAHAGTMPDDARGLSALLRARRAELGITQAELARRAGMSVRAVRYLEQGRIQNPRTASVQQLVAALDAVTDEPAPTRIGILGPLLVEAGGSEHHLGVTRPARLLGLLALRLNRPVAIDEITDVLWDGRPPRAARAEHR